MSSQTGGAQQGLDRPAELQVKILERAPRRDTVLHVSSLHLQPPECRHGTHLKDYRRAARLSLAGVSVTAGLCGSCIYLYRIRAPRR
ncbi:unnamed protein product [Lota lota]